MSDTRGLFVSVGLLLVAPTVVSAAKGKPSGRTDVVFTAMGTGDAAFRRVIDDGIVAGLRAAGRRALSQRALKSLRGPRRTRIERCGGEPACLAPLVPKLGGTHGIVATVFRGDDGGRTIHLRRFDPTGEVTDNTTVRLIEGDDVETKVSEAVSTMLAGGPEQADGLTEHVAQGPEGGVANTAVQPSPSGESGADQERADLIEAPALEEPPAVVDDLALAAPPPPPPTITTEGPEHLLTLVGIGTGGLAVILAGVGTYFGYRSRTLRDDIEPGKDSLFAADRKLDRAESAASLSNVFYIAAAGAAVVGGGLIAIDLLVLAED